MKRIMVFLYGVVSYLAFLATFVYAAGWVGNVLAPKSIDSAPTDPLPVALAINVCLLALFAVQHSVMARPAFKTWWTRIIPREAERSTYVLFSSLALIVLFWQWRPMGGVVWEIESAAGKAIMWSVFAAGWGLVLASTFLINHFDLFGLRQVWLYLKGEEYTPLPFKTPAIYRHVRHPLYVGWFLAFWGTPTMTAAHLLFALMTTAYIVIAVRWEERDLKVAHPEYEPYCDAVPMFVPRMSPAALTPPAQEEPGVA